LKLRAVLSPKSKLMDDADDVVGAATVFYGIFDTKPGSQQASRAQRATEAWLVLACVAGSMIGVADAETPYSPLQGFSYYVEADRSVPWPDCNFRFLSCTDDCQTAIDIRNEIGENQAFTLESGSNSTWVLKSKCGSYLSYSSLCSNLGISATASSALGEWNVASQSGLAWTLEAAGRSACPNRYLSYSQDCDEHSVVMGDAALGSSRFLLQAAHGSKMVHVQNTGNETCADPFMWHEAASGAYKLVCTQNSGNRSMMLPLLTSSVLSAESRFEGRGEMLGGTPAEWASGSERWAPETMALDGGKNLGIFCDTDANGTHRIGTVMSVSGANNAAWDNYSHDFVDLGGSAGGDIDPHFFKDPFDGTVYLVWKTDDNNVGLQYTRIWAAPIALPATSGASLTLLGPPTQLLDSTGLWWVDSWVQDGSLIEGPEVFHRQGFYYLFFAAGKFCTESYSEGVARATSFLGPYEKLGVPVLSSSLVGVGTSGEKLIGPGHASFVQNAHGTLFMAWHASEGENCARFAYVDRVAWTLDGWPICDFTPLNQTHYA
jgi:hypothetical protein